MSEGHFQLFANAPSPTEARLLARRLMAIKVVTTEDLCRKTGISRGGMLNLLHGSHTTPWLRFEIERILGQPIWSDPNFFEVLDIMSVCLGQNVLAMPIKTLRARFSVAEPAAWVSRQSWTRAEIVQWILENCSGTSPMPGTDSSADDTLNQK